MICSIPLIFMIVESLQRPNSIIKMPISMVKIEENLADPSMREIKRFALSQEPHEICKQNGYTCALEVLISEDAPLIGCVFSEDGTK